jgi:hypothetical protein
MRARAATPPTTPPAMAPTGVSEPESELESEFEPGFEPDSGSSESVLSPEELSESVNLVSLIHD